MWFQNLIRSVYLLAFLGLCHFLSSHNLFVGASVPPLEHRSSAEVLSLRRRRARPPPLLIFSFPLVNSSNCLRDPSRRILLFWHTGVTEFLIAGIFGLLCPWIFPGPTVFCHPCSVHRHFAYLLFDDGVRILGGAPVADATVLPPFPPLEIPASPCLRHVPEIRKHSSSVLPPNPPFLLPRTSFLCLAHPHVIQPKAA